MSSTTETRTLVDAIVDNADERELWIVGREFERPPYFHAGKGGDTRLARALRVCVEGRITPNSDGSYTVEGSEHRSYRVADSCSCPQSQKATSKWCYHAVAVALYVEWQRRLRPMAPVVLGTLRPGTLPLTPTTVDERLARTMEAIDTMNDAAAAVRLSVYDAPASRTHHTPCGALGDVMPDDEYILEPDNKGTPTATVEPPAQLPAPRHLPGPVLLPSLDAQSLERSMQAYAAQRQVVTRYIKEQMTEGVDYYTLTIKGRVTKATLSKAGSEKFLSLFQLSAQFQQDEATWRMLGSKDGLLCYTCHLLTRSGEVVGEGRGARNVAQDGGDINKAIKMATKCLGGTTPVLIRSTQGITRTLLNKLEGRDFSNLWIAGPGATWRKIVRVEAQPIAPVRRLLFRDGLQVTASLDHRWPLIDGTLVDTAQLRVGDCIQRSLLPTGTGQADQDFPWMAGLFVAEGSLSNDTTLRFHLHAKEEDLGTRLQHIATRLGASCGITIDGNRQTVTLVGQAVMGLMEQFVQGRLSYGKHFTGYLFRQNEKGLTAALGGYLAGDGCYTERDGRQPFWQLGFTRKNHALAHDLRTLCAMLGYRCRLGLGRSAARKAGKLFERYHGWIQTEAPRYNGQDLGRIMDISEGAEMTYEVEVDGDHLFCLANGLVTHNSSQVDAVLRTGALSDVFTQDISDHDEDATPQGTPEPPMTHAAKSTSQELRQRIWTMIQAQAPHVTTREAVEAWIQERTGYALHPDFYRDILTSLERSA